MQYCSVPAKAPRPTWTTRGVDSFDVSPFDGNAMTERTDEQIAGDCPTGPSGLAVGKPLAEAGSGLVDGRQSPAALAIARGTMRMLAAHKFSPLTEVVLPSGRRADLVAVSEKGEIWIIEIKSGIEDFRSDQKWPEYREFCDRFLFAVDSDFPDEIIPQDTGLIVADRFNAEIIRSSETQDLPAARRKSLILRFARIAGARLHALADPEASIEIPGRY